jgi:hypothetical protein
MITGQLLPSVRSRCVDLDIDDFGLVDVVRLALNSVSTRVSLSSTDVRTSILKEFSLCAFVEFVLRRDLAHNLLDRGFNSLLVHWVSLVYLSSV